MEIKNGRSWMPKKKQKKKTLWPPVLNQPPKVSLGMKLFKCNHVQHQVSHVMRKPFYAIREQQKFWSDCAIYTVWSAVLFVHCFDSIIPIVAKPKVSSLSLVSVAEQTGLSLTWSHTTEDRFTRDHAQIKLVSMRPITLSLLTVSRVLGVLTFVAAEVIINVSNRLQLLDTRT